MTTVRQIERQWDARKYRQLFAELIVNRPEASIRVDADCSAAVPACAIALIRLDEIGQSHVPLYSRLVRALIATQQADGGWGDLMVTALALRALLCGRGQGAVIARGMEYLANLQKPEGIWPRIPVRRMPADAHVSAYVMLQLGNVADFRDAVRFCDAVNWFIANESTMEPDAHRIWDRARVKCRLPRMIASPALWS